MIKEFVKTFGKFTVRFEINTAKWNDSKVEFYDSRYVKGFENTKCGCQYITSYEANDILMAFAKLKDNDGNHFELYSNIKEWWLNKNEISSCFWWMLECRTTCM